MRTVLYNFFWLIFHYFLWLIFRALINTVLPLKEKQRGPKMTNILSLFQSCPSIKLWQPFCKVSLPAFAWPTTLRFLELGTFSLHFSTNSFHLGPGNHAMLSLGTLQLAFWPLNLWTFPPVKISHPSIPDIKDLPVSNCIIEHFDQNSFHDVKN